MAVGVQGDAGRGVAELGLDRLDAGALGDQQRRAGVAQVVQPQRVGQPGGAQSRLEEALDPGSWEMAASKAVRDLPARDSPIKRTKGRRWRRYSRSSLTHELDLGAQSTAESSPAHGSAREC